jgi:molecular chaperone DnaJ
MWYGLRIIPDPSDDYYALLGIDEGTDAAQLRRVWRRLALRWHPDHAGPGATATFQKLSAAYEVLSDTVARAAYDRRRGRAAHRTSTRADAAPAAPPATSRRRAPGVMLARLCGSLNVLLSCGVARWTEGDIIELLLSAREAEQGGMVTISMRVPVRCIACGGRNVASCSRCEGQGTVEELFSAWLAVPPEARDGTILLPSALLRGMVRPVRFRTRVRPLRRKA